MLPNFDINSFRNKTGKSYFDEDVEKVLLFNIPKKKQGKLSKDFNKTFNKLLSELDLHPDEGGKIRFKEKIWQIMEQPLIQRGSNVKSPKIIFQKKLP